MNPKEMLGEDKLRRFIAKHISYESDGGEVCPHCKKYVKEPHYWLYHKWTLAHKIAKFLGFGDNIGDIISGELEELYGITGEPKEDGKLIAELIKERIIK